MRFLALVAVSLCLSVSNVALAHTSVGGGGSSVDPDADCLRWVAVPLTAADGGVDAAVDASTDGGDAGSDGGTTVVVTKLVCVEHATMFGCACALGPGRADASAAASVFVAAVAALAAVSRRRRKRRPDSQEVTP
jgi:hypothetical protein